MNQEGQCQNNENNFAFYLLVKDLEIFFCVDFATLPVAVSRPTELNGLLGSNIAYY